MHTRRIGNKINLRVIDDKNDSSSASESEATNSALGPEALQRLRGIVKDKKRNPHPSLQQIILAIDKACDPFDPANLLPEEYKKAYSEARGRVTQDLITRAERKRLLKRGVK